MSRTLAVLQHSRRLLPTSRTTLGSCSFASAVFPASKFHSIISLQTPAQKLFDGVPLANLCPKVRGDLLSDIAREIVSQLYPHMVVSDAVSGSCWDGRRRGSGRAEYDWRWAGRQVEVKSSQFGWNSSHDCWRFVFRNVKFPSAELGVDQHFDILILVLYTPEALLIYQHDAALGVSTAGLETKHVGHLVQLNGPTKEDDWRKALHRVQGRLNATKCRFLAEILLSSPMIADALTRRLESASAMDQAFSGVPLSSIPPQIRGRRISQIVREIDGQLRGNVSDPMCGVCVNGSRRSLSNAEFDWRQLGSRVECKSAKLCWVPRGAKWWCHFKGIKFGLFDELFIALYSPLGLHIYRHDLRLGVTSNGPATQSRGHSIALSAPARETNYLVALDAITAKLRQSACEYFAFVDWSR